MRDVFGSVRFRLTIAATLLVLAGLGAGAVALVTLVESRAEDRIRSDSRDLVAGIGAQLEAGVPLDQAVLLSPDPAVVQVIGSDGLPLATVTGAVPLGSFAATPIDGDAITISDQFFYDGSSVFVQATHPLTEVRRGIDELSNALLWSVPAAVALFAVGTWFVVGRALRPVELIRRRVDAISHETLHRRVPLPPSTDEVRALAETMNQMLDRLERSSIAQRTFIADASHELRTPIAVARAALEVGASAVSDANAAEAFVAALAAQRRVEVVVGDLLTLARVEDGAPAAVAVDLEEVVFEEVAAGYPTRAIDTRGVVAGRVGGDRNEFGRVVRNLIDNGVRHADRVRVSLDQRDGIVELVVEDDGRGVPPDEIERIFERFARVDDDRGRESGGTGLGLAIVKAVAAQRGGAVRVETSSHLGGARFIVSLPAYSG